MKGTYLLAYVFTLNGTTGVGSADVTLEQDQPITPEVIRAAIRKIREGCGWDESVSVAPLSWCRYEHPATIINQESCKGGAENG